MTVQIIVPDLGESVTEATVARWLKQEGDPVAVGEPLVELETDKINLEVGAEHDGVLVRIVQAVGADVRAGDVLAEVAEAGESAPPPRAVQSAMPTDRAGEEPKVSPVARRLAREHGIDLGAVQGSGPGARVTRSDVERYVASLEPPPGEAAAAPLPAAAPPLSAPPDGLRPQERVRMTRRRRTIGRRLVESLHSAAMLTTFNEVDMGAVMELRRRYKQAFQERHGVSLGITSFFVKAAVGALQEFPRLNAEIDGDEMILKHYYDIGVAIGDPEGLIVPVLRDADALSFVEIERAIRAFAAQAQDGTLSLEDLRGGTFTITNGGVFGSMLSTPILNPPQVGILGLHNIVDRPVAIEGAVIVRPIMYLALSYDHRLVDGREAVQFLVRIKQLIEDPAALLLEI